MSNSLSHPAVAPAMATPTPTLNAAPTIVIAPDSFKGSLDAAAVANAIASGIRRVLPQADIRCRPMADGGEGTLDALLTGPARRHDVRAAHAGAIWLSETDAHASMPQANVAIALLGNGDALIESASIVGITDERGMQVSVEHRSTTGIGEALSALLDHIDTAPVTADRTDTGQAPVKVRETRVFVALGGSSTNDGGAGMLCALGARLLDADAQPLPPIPSAFGRLASIDISSLDARLRRIQLVAMSDVDNPLCGPSGATAIFGPQKGVTAEQLPVLDAALTRFADCLEAAVGRVRRDAPGAGAAGGLGYALLMLDAVFQPGADVVAEQIGLGTALVGADWMITGEGRSDAQTLRGKAPFVACRRARAMGVPTTLISGAVDRTALRELSTHFLGCVSIAPGPITLDSAIEQAAALLADAGEQLARVRFGR